MLDAVASGSLDGAIAHLAGADSFVAIPAAFDAFTLHDLARTAVFDSLAALLDRVTGGGPLLRLQQRAFAFQALPATEIALTALLFAIAA